MADAPVELAELVQRIAQAALDVPARTLVAQPALPGVAPHALAVSAARLALTLDVEGASEGGLFFAARRRKGIAARLRVDAALLPALEATAPATAAPELIVVRPPWWLPPDRRGKVGVRLPDGRELRIGQRTDGRVLEWFWPDDSIVEEVPEPGKALAPLIGLMHRMAETPAPAEGELEQELPRRAPAGILRMVQACHRLGADWHAARRGLAELGAAQRHHGAVVLGGYVLGPMRVRVEQPLDGTLEAAGPGADPEEVISLGVSFELPDRAGERPAARLRISPPDALAEGEVHAAFAAALRERATALERRLPGARDRLRDPPDVVMRLRQAVDDAGWDEDVILYDRGRGQGVPPLMFLVEARVTAGPSVELRKAKPLGLDPDVPGGMAEDEAEAWRRIAAVLGQHVAAISAWMGARA